MRTRLTSRLSLLFMSFALVLAIPAMALADVTIDTSVDLGTSATTPTNVNVGANNFTIKVWGADGNLPDGKSGVVTVGNAYSMSADGTITQTGTYNVDLENRNYNQCPSTGTIPLGCPGNPVKVPATLTVAAGAADGTAGLLKITQSVLNGSGLNIDQSPASGNVKVVVPQAQKQNQTINFGALGAKTFGNANFNVSATASSGLAVSFAATGNCSIDANNAVTITGAGNCDITASQAGNNNYNAAPNVVQGFTIHKKTATVDLSNLNQVYDGSAKSVGASTTNPAGLNANVTYDGSTTAPTNAGSYAVVANVSDNNYQGTATGTLVIDKAATTTTVSCGAGPFTYDGSAQTPCSASVSGPGGLSESVAVSYQNNTNAGTATASASYAPTATSNYQGSNDSKTFTIGKAGTITTVSCGAGPFTYDGSAQTPCSVSVTGARGLSLNPAANYSNNTNAGTATASYTYAENGNYNGSNDSKTFQIARKPITGSFTADNKVYDGGRSADVLSRAVNPADVVGDDVVTLTGGTAAFEDKNVGNNKTVTLTNATLGGADAGNYTLSSVDTTTANITQRGLVVTAKAANKEYDGNTNASVFLSDNRVTGDVLTTGYASASFDNANAGTGKVVSVTGISVTGTDSRNYSFNTNTTTSADITPRSIAVSAEPKSKTYGDADPALTYRITSGELVGADGFTGALSRVAGENAGNYAIQQNSLALSSNYTLSYTPANLTINQAPITVKANDVSRYYGEANNLSYSIVSGGFKFNDDTNGGVSVNLSTEANATSKFGNYPITVSLSGPKAGNYAFTGQPGTLTITAWTNQGFFSPVDYGTTQNTVKNGSTVPLKFRVFQGSQQLTSTSIVGGLKPAVTNCATGTPIDDIEELATGGTSLRYDATAGQFIFNWQTPRKPGTCYNVTVQMVDGTQIPVAKFWLK